MIQLRSSDGDIIKIEAKNAKCSGTIKAMLEDMGMDDDSDAESVVPLPNVDSTILQLVVQWANHHKDDVWPDQFSGYISQWDMDFLKIDQVTLFGLLVAANYLDIKGLTDICAQTIANLVKGKSTEQIQKTFNIKNEFVRMEEDE